MHWNTHLIEILYVASILLQEKFSMYLILDLLLD